MELEDKVPNSQIKDHEGQEIKVGDTIGLFYVDPVGNLHKDSIDRQYVVEFKYGTFGIQTRICFVPLMEFMTAKSGDYVPNYGNKMVYTEKYNFLKINK